MNVLFAGTPDFAVPSLKQVLAMAQVKLVGILTNPDAPGKRGTRLLPPPVKQEALGSAPQVPIFQPMRLDASLRQAIAELEPELLVCVAYGKIFGPKFLALFPRGGINLHPSLLPAYRGPSPIQAALWDGLSESGITVQELGLEMDAGPILIQEPRTILPEDDALSLSQRWSEEGALLLRRTIQGLVDGKITPKTQDHSRASYCSLLGKEMAEIDWTSPAAEIANRVRALVPWPLATTSLNHQKLFIHRAQARPQSEIPIAQPGTLVSVDTQRGILVQTGLDLLQIHRLQLQNKKAMDWKDFINGARDAAGARLGGPHGSDA